MAEMTGRKTQMPQHRPGLLQGWEVIADHETTPGEYLAEAGDSDHALLPQSFRAVLAVMEEGAEDFTAAGVDDGAEGRIVRWDVGGQGRERGNAEEGEAESEGQSLGRSDAGAQSGERSGSARNGEGGQIAKGYAERGKEMFRRGDNPFGMTFGVEEGDLAEDARG